MEKSDVEKKERWRGRKCLYRESREKKREKTKTKQIKKGKSKYARWGPEIPGRSTLTPGIYLDLKRHTLYLIV